MPTSGGIDVCPRGSLILCCHSSPPFERTVFLHNVLLGTFKSGIEPSFFTCKHLNELLHLEPMAETSPNPPAAVRKKRNTHPNSNLFRMFLVRKYSTKRNPPSQRLGLFGLAIEPPGALSITGLTSEDR